MQLNILLVAATPLESSRLIERLGLQGGGHLYHGQLKKLNLTLLVTGIGMVNTAWQLGQVLGREHIDLVLNYGICGSYSGHPIGTVVEVSHECYGDLGATQPDGSLLGLEEMGFPVFELMDRAYYNDIANPYAPVTTLPQVRGITVNTVAGDEALIALRRSTWRPDVETMEGAAVFQCCLQAGILFHAFRCVSNAVTPRDRSQWDIPGAAARLQEFMYDHLMLLTHEAEAGH